MITDTEVQEFIRTISMTDREWGQYKVKRDGLRRGICIVYDPIPDTEPTELTFRRTDEPIDDDGGPYVVAWMFWCTVLWGIAACAAFVWLGGK